jgi:hypothetical protein
MYQIYKVILNWISYAHTYWPAIWLFSQQPLTVLCTIFPHVRAITIEASWIYGCTSYIQGSLLK